MLISVKVSYIVYIKSTCFMCMCFKELLFLCYEQNALFTDPLPHSYIW